MNLNQVLSNSMKIAMREKNKLRLGTIRLIRADIKRVEIDKRRTLDDSEILLVLDKMLRQRRDSIKQYESAGRQELAETEAAEIAVIQEFLPKQLSKHEVNALIESAIQESKASTLKDMGLVMAALKPKVQGLADMKEVSLIVKSLLS
ncbi:MAG: glutamyl-tRNA amidotransferase [Porticoccaceae bacterium]|nr:glutamyl-tRNA amidotransferase [Porticoccaceae bacterium]